MKNNLAIAVIIILSLSAMHAESGDETSPLSYSLSPAVIVPLGGDADTFAFGGGARLSVEYAPESLERLALQMGLLYDFQPLQADAGSISTVTALAGPSWFLPLGAKFSAFLSGNVGYSFGIMNGSGIQEGGGSMVAEAGGGLAYAFDARVKLRLGLGYLYYAGLFGAANASLAASITPPPPRAKTIIVPSKPGLNNLEIGDIELYNVFPVFRAWYDQHPLGKVVVKNAGKKTIKSVSVSFFLKQYMDGPKECATIAELKPGQTRELPLFALFNDSILDVTEATKATAQVDASFIEAGERQSQSRTATLRVYDRNAMTWDDDRKAAAFVSGKDPWVMEFSANVVAMTKGSMNPFISKNLQTAIAFHDALRIYGLSYTPSPTNPYSQTSANPAIVDYLRFPRQTFSGKSGDCSDLSILYASLFESVGIETAFITVPGHIFMALSLDMSAEEAKANVASFDDLVIRDGEAWLPIETTLRDQGLLEAWREAAREWKRCSAEGSAAFYAIHEAWKLFEPEGLAAEKGAPKMPESAQVKRVFASELAEYSRQELGARLAAINSAIAASGGTAKELNARGVVYAKYGKPELAEKDFQASLKKKGDYFPALVNLGNAARQKNDAQASYSYYQKASKLAPDNAKVLINVALAADALGKATEAQAALEEAKRIDPELAAKYGFIADRGNAGTRGAETGSGAPIWIVE
jgi:tetratricopeptide (TPR) repeat protein